MDEDANWYGVDLSAGHIVLDGFPAFRERGTAPPSLLVSCLLWPRSPISATVELLLNVWKRKATRTTNSRSYFAVVLERTQLSVHCVVLTKVVKARYGTIADIRMRNPTTNRSHSMIKLGGGLHSLHAFLFELHPYVHRKCCQLSFLRFHDT